VFLRHEKDGPGRGREQETRGQRTKHKRGKKKKGWEDSHSVASAHSSVHVWGIVGTAGTTLNNLAATAGDGTWVSGSGGGVLGRVAGDGSVALDVTTALLNSLLGLLLGTGSGEGVRVLLVLLDGPVEEVVVDLTLANKEITEDLAEVGVVWLVVEAEGTGVVEVDSKLVGQTVTEDLGWGGHLLLHDLVVLFLLEVTVHTLPWKLSLEEVDEHVAQGLHVVAAGLLCEEVSAGGDLAAKPSKEIKTYRHPSGC
jgi:hypothetical protein